MKDNEFRKLIDDVLDRTDIVEVIGQRINLDRNHKAICPFHNDTEPSFSVNPSGQYFYCFGCGVGGDVIKFLELYENRPFWDILTDLARQAGVSIDADAIHDANQMQERRKIEDVLSAAASYYHNCLTEEAKGYLINVRGFSEETITRFRVGYARGDLLKHLLGECGFSTETCVKAGVIRQAENGSYKDFFNKRIIFPNLRRGQVVHLTGRNLDNSEPKYLHLPSPIRYLYNEDALYNKEVLITEGIPDCLSAIQAGYAAVAVYGTSQFNEKYSSRFSRCKRVFICLDPDEAGIKASRRIADVLADRAIVVQMPEGYDLNQYLMQYSPEEFSTRLNGSRPYLDMEIDRIKCLPEHAQLSQIQDFLPNLAKLEPFIQDHYSDIVKKKFRLSKKTIKTGIKQNPTHGSSQTIPEQTAPPPAFTEDERRKTEEILNDPDLLEKFNEMTERLGCVGEENNKIMIYMTLASRILENPISLIVKGESSGGKSFLIDIVRRFFPEEEIMAFTTITPKALYHRTDDLSHKALIIFERPGAEDSDYSIRSLQSEKKLIISTSVKDPDTGRWVAEDHEILGPVAYIETTTKTHLHTENETRCFETFIDDSEKQTNRILTAQRQKYSGQVATDDSCLRPWIAAQKILKPYPINIPYVDLIKFPGRPIRVRRDFPRFLTLIEVSAILHQFQRKRKKIDGAEYLVADVEDYAIAYSLASVILQQTIKQISPKAEELAERIGASFQGKSVDPLTRREIGNLMNWDIKTVIKYIRECVNQGFIDEETSGRAFKYRFIRSPDICDNLLLAPDRLREILEKNYLSNRGKPIQNGVGQVNELGNNGLIPPVQSVHGGCSEKSEMGVLINERNQDSPPLSGG